MRQREVTLKYRRPSTAQIAGAKILLAVNVTDKELIGKMPRLAQHYARNTVNGAEREPETLTVPVRAIRIGDFAVCGIPFEVFVEIGLDLKKRSPFPQNMVIGLALGGCETWIGTNPVQEEASVILTNHLLEMLPELRQES